MRCGNCGPEWLLRRSARVGPADSKASPPVPLPPVKATAENEPQHSRSSSASSDSSIEQPLQRVNNPRVHLSSVADLAKSIHDLARSVSQRIRPSSSQSSDLLRQLHTDKKLRIFVGTWNMHGKPPPMDLAPFLKRSVPFAETNDIGPHIIAIGTQECERSIEKSVVYPSKELWEAFLMEYLSARYELLRSETMAAIHLAVFVIREVKHLFQKTESGSIATGIGNVIGNKGGVGVGINLADKISILFMNSHFTAHQNRVEERNMDFDRIRREIPLKGYRKTKSKDISDKYDYTFWFGDLNYRINGTRKMVDSLLQDQMMEVLLANDQLSIERKKGKVFQEFEEADITFFPTYKFDVMKSLMQGNDYALKRKKSFGLRRPRLSSMRSSNDPAEIRNSAFLNAPENSNIGRLPPIFVDTASPVEGPVGGVSTISRILSYDSSKKQRIPSWTDRILFKSRFTTVEILDEQTQKRKHSKVPVVAPARNERYDSCMDMEWSDHKPVLAHFSIDFDWSPVLKDRGNSKNNTSKTSSRCSIM